MAVEKAELRYPRENRQFVDRYLRSTVVSGGSHQISVVQLDGEDIESVFVRHVQLRCISMPYRVFRRALDILVSFTAILVLLPLLLMIAIAVKLTSRGSVLYASTRVGLGGRPIKFYKFRTMVADADQVHYKLVHLNEKDGPIFKVKADPRITRVGSFLRRYSLDELPQLWQVLTGKLTLVGPRPHLPSEVAKYDDHCWERLSVKPGLTCYWQVQGRSELDFETWIELDLQYLREMSPVTDLKVLAKTPLAIISARGAY